jgi:PEP-CTERM motif
MRLSKHLLWAFAVSLLLPLTLTITSRTAYADTIDFSYTSVDNENFGDGSGSFTYIGSPSALTLASLTNFTFTLSTYVNVPLFETFISTYSKTDLNSFSATLSGDTLTTLSLQTGFTGAFAMQFQVYSLGANETGTYSLDGPYSVGMVTETGSSVDPSAVPEPSTLALFGTGILSLASVARLSH